jgi:hypothetical protein
MSSGTWRASETQSGACWATIVAMIAAKIAGKDEDKSYATLRHEKTRRQNANLFLALKTKSDFMSELYTSDYGPRLTYLATCLKKTFAFDQVMMVNDDDDERSQ